MEGEREPVCCPVPESGEQRTVRPALSPTRWVQTCWLSCRPGHCTAPAGGTGDLCTSRRCERSGESFSEAQGPGKARGGLCKQGLPRAVLRRRRAKTYQGKVRVSFPHANGSVGAEKMLNTEKHWSYSSPCSTPLSQQSRDGSEERMGSCLADCHCTLILAQQRHKSKCKCVKNVRLNLVVYQKCRFPIATKGSTLWGVQNRGTIGKIIPFQKFYNPTLL